MIFCGVVLLCAGNGNLHLMTSVKRQHLRVDIADWEGNETPAMLSTTTLDWARLLTNSLASLGTCNGTADVYTVGHRNVPLYFCLYLRQLLTDFQKIFTVTYC